MLSETSRRQSAGAVYRVLFAFLLRLVKDHAVAEDLAQTTFELVLRDGRCDLTCPEAIGYFKRRARWLALSHFRRRARRPAPLLVEAPDPHLLRPDQILQAGERRQRVRQAVAGLPDGDRAVVNCYLDGMSHDETAAHLNLPVRKVYIRFHRAKARLRRLLRPDDRAGG